MMTTTSSTTRRLTAVAACAMILAAAGCGSTSSAVSGSGARQAHSRAPDPLLGGWDSGPVPIRRIRAAVHAAGYTPVEVAAFLREFGITHAHTYEFRLGFYREGGRPFVVQRGWDPSRGGVPQDGDHGPYRLLRRQRVAITSADPTINKYRYVFSYTVTGHMLHLHVTSSTNPGITPKRLRLDTSLLYALTATPLQRTG
jgi:hypothetical protein